MTDSELLERMDNALQQIKEAIEARGALLELDKKPDFRWAGMARMPVRQVDDPDSKDGKTSRPGEQETRSGSYS